MTSSTECRALHLTASLHVKYKRAKIINLVTRLQILLSAYTSKDVNLIDDMFSLDSRHYLHILDIKINEENGYFAILIGNTDIAGRDATYSSSKKVRKYRHFEREEGEGHFSSAHLVIALNPDADTPGMHYAILEECPGLNRSRISSFMTHIIQKCAGYIAPTEDDGKSPMPMFKLDVTTDQNLAAQANRIKIKAITVSANLPVDPTAFFETEQSVRFKVAAPRRGLESARSALKLAMESAHQIIPAWKKMAVQVQRPDGRLATLRSEGHEGDKLAEAFQKIDVLPLDEEVRVFPSVCVDEIVTRMARCLRGNKA